MSDIYQILNNAWKTTSKVIFGEEVGELKDYEEWLSEYAIMNAVEKEGIYISSEYANAKRVMDYEESIKKRNFEPLNINEIKDIDSIFEALKERFYYTGNVILGNSQNVEKSTEIADSFNVYRSRTIYSSKNVAYSTFIRDSEFVFGSSSSAISNFSIKTNFTGGELNTRNFELFASAGTSDSYYSCNIMYSSNVMFSFGIQNDSYYIGNIKLEKSKYMELKEKLLGEIREELKDKKKLPSLVEVLSQPRKRGEDLFKQIRIEYKEEPTNKKVIEDAFSSTSKILIGKELKNIDDYEHFLTKNLPDKMEYVVSPISRRKVYYLPNFWFAKNFRHKYLEWEEVFELGKVLKNDISNFEEGKKAEMYVSYNGREKYINTIESLCPFRAQDSYKVADPGFSKKTGFSIWVRDSQYIFGGFITQKSSFAINAMNSFKITRAFEVNSCSNSEDIYFSHGLTNVSNAMFSFGKLGGRNLIGNVEYGREEYQNIKKNILGQIGEELEAKKDLKYSVLSF